MNEIYAFASNQIKRTFRTHTHIYLYTTLTRARKHRKFNEISTNSNIQWRILVAIYKRMKYIYGRNTFKFEYDRVIRNTMEIVKTLCHLEA